MGDSVEVGKKKMHFNKSTLNCIICPLWRDDNTILRGFLAMKTIAIMIKEFPIKKKIIA